MKSRSNSVQKKKTPPDVSMTPASFERSQSKTKKKAAKLRRSFDGDATTQVFETSVLSQGDSAGDISQTPLTLSQISAIHPGEGDTMTTTFSTKSGKRRRGNDDTLELAVQAARGEPDGQEGDRSFTRKQLDKLSLVGDVEMTSEPEASPSPRKKVKVSSKDTSTTPSSTPVKKEKKLSKLKLPFKKDGKKQEIKKQKEGTSPDKKKKKNFEKLPDETQIPQTPNKTWKEKKKERKMLKNNYDVINEAKKAWEELRKADLPAVKRTKICNELMTLVTGKVKQLVKVHDSARVIQCLVQYGNDAQRTQIYQELKDDICELCCKKYAKYVVRKMIHYGTKELRGQVMSSFKGHVRKMIRHKEASDILEYAFNEFATAPQRLAILEEFYGPTFSLFKDTAGQSLDSIMSEQPDKAHMVIRSLKDALAPLVDKEILGHSLVHKVFYDFFAHADDKSKKEMVEGLREHLPQMLHTRDGTRVAMHCLWAGSVKDRKAIVKAFKGHVSKLCCEEAGHLALMAVFDTVDDTVLVNKAIVDEIIKNIGDVVANPHGRKVLQYLLGERDTQTCHPDVAKILAQGDANTTSKKERSVRAKELRTHVSPGLLNYLIGNAATMMANPQLALLAKDIIMHAEGDVKPAMKALADLVAGSSESPDAALSVVEHPAAHIALKKIIAHDKARMEAGSGILFSSILLEALPKSTIKVWAASNRGCFVLLCLLEVGCSTVSERVRAAVQPVRKSLAKMTFKGAELLIQKLDQTQEFHI